MLSGGKEVWDYGVNSWNYEENRPDYYIGIPSGHASGDTEGTMELCIPGGLYAVFSTLAAEQDTFVIRIHKIWDYIKEWFPVSGYKHKSSYEFECYRKKSRLFSEDICIPVDTEAERRKFI